MGDHTRNSGAAIFFLFFWYIIYTCAIHLFSTSYTYLYYTISISYFRLIVSILSTHGHPAYGRCDCSFFNPNTTEIAYINSSLLNFCLSLLYFISRAGRCLAVARIEPVDSLSSIKPTVGWRFLRAKTELFTIAHNQIVPLQQGFP